MKFIPLSNTDLVALVDDSDFENLSRFKWAPLKSKTHHTTYAVRKTTTKGGQKMRSVLMHREVMGLEHGDKKLVDHKNQNGLDNQKGNLRVTTKQVNALNSSRPVKSLTGFIGVSYHPGKENSQRPSKTPYAAKIKFNQKEFCLGSFVSAVDAARAYDKKAINFFGADARLNFPDEAKCPDCFHELHKPGCCQHDDCGEAEISRSRDFEFEFMHDTRGNK